VNAAVAIGSALLARAGVERRGRSGRIAHAFAHSIARALSTG
jgi:hypothetical protein